MSELHSVTIKPWNMIFHVEVGTNLRDFFLREGILIDFPCGGKGLCMQCRVRIDPPTDSGKKGRRSLPHEELYRGIRLACQTVIEHDCTVTLMESGKAGIRWESGETEGITVTAIPGEPAVTRKAVSLKKPSIENQESDTKRLKKALIREGVKPNPADRCIVDLSQAEILSRSLRKNDWKVDVVLDRTSGVELLGVTERPSEEKASSSEIVSGRGIFGFAIDLGTTTIDIALHDLETGGMVLRKTLLNRQTSFGADVISRVEAFRKDRRGVRTAVLETIGEGCNAILHEAGITADTVFKSVVVGNPIMLHIFNDIDPYELTLSPYIPVISETVREVPAYYGFDFQAWGIVEILPVISAYVGADTVGMILALSIDREDIVSLSVDIGTNGEIVLSRRGELFATSTAAGPAFEGAQISCGMRAIDGAVYSVEIDREREEWAFRFEIIGNGQGSPIRGICGTGLVSLLAELLDAGLVDRTGRLLRPEEIHDERARRVAKERVFTIDKQTAFSLTEDRRVYITQRDIRELQLAKGAIRTGIESLLSELSLSAQDLTVIRLAGNFGAGMDVKAAIRIGLIPGVSPAMVDIAGNAALRGASLALVSREAGKRARAIAENTRFLELAGKPEFQMRFSEAMLF